MELFLGIIVVTALVFLIWDCVEVGRNDAANLVNAVFGSRSLERRKAVLVAGIAVILGATFASPVMETARKGIFDPGMLSIQMAMVVYITAYIVDTALLSTYSAYGMPVSTTASLVFELIGASIAVAAFSKMQVTGQPWYEIVHWAKVGKVVGAIVMSIVLSGIAGFLVQRMFRAVIRDVHDDHDRVKLHGPWMAGLMLTWLVWFMVIKGLKAVPWIKELKKATVDNEQLGPLVCLLILWGALTLAVHVYLKIRGEGGTKTLFRDLAIVGMVCMSFAFGQNDLANCASPGLSALWLWQHKEETTAIASKVAIPVWALFGCGVLMVTGMMSKNAQRVTRAAVNTGSQYDNIALYAPKWCRRIARLLLRNKIQEEALVPEARRDEHQKRVHFDALRAAVIMAVSASVIAFASGGGLPVSTTYVTFAAVVSTGMADRVMSRGDADRKIGRAIWVVFSWFAGAVLAMVASALVATVIVKLNIAGLVIAVVANFVLRAVVKKRSAQHEERHHIEATKAADAQESPGRIG